jgi:hypothetical protein
MLRRKALALAMSPLVLMVALFAGAAAAQQATQQRLVGTWTLVLVDNVFPDGSRLQLYGANPQGIAMFDADGHYSLQIMSERRPKFAAGDKSKGTAEEYKAAVQGSNCHFGKYTVNDADHTVTLHVEHATFSNWEGTDLQWPLAFAGNELRLTIPHPTSGGANVTGEVVLRRASTAG